MAHYVYVVEVGTIECDNIGSDIKVFVEKSNAFDYLAGVFTTVCEDYYNFKSSEEGDNRKMLFFNEQNNLRKSIILTKVELCGDSFSY